jgi:hypothetical protein
MNQMNDKQTTANGARRRHFQTVTAAITACAVLATQSGAFAQPPPGTQLQGTITSSLNTSNAFVGEDVTVANVASENGAIQGALLRGTVTNVTRAGLGRSAQIGLTFNYLTLANGTTEPIDAQTLSVNAQTKSNAATEAGGALGGMVAGNAIAKTLFAASGGGLIGAVGGFLLAKNSRQNMTVPAGSVVAVRIVTPRRQAQSGG